MDKVKIGVVGLGVGKKHIEEYLKNKKAELVAICDINKDILKNFVEKYNVRGYESFEDMIKNEELNGVSICTPPKFHLPLIQIAAENKINILCEKPMASNMEEALRIVEVCKNNGVKLMIGFKKRFSPTYRFLKKCFENEFGKPNWLFIKFALGKVDKDWFWEENNGGGPIIENTIHVLDLLIFFLGLPERVYAEGGKLFQEKYDQIDGALITIKFKNGSIASIGAGYASEWSIAEEEICFANEKVAGKVKGRFDFPNILQYVFRKEPEKIYRKRFSNPAGFKEEIEHFIKCIKENKEPLANGEDGINSLKLALAIKKSIKEERIILL